MPEDISIVEDDARIAKLLRRGLGHGATGCIGPAMSGRVWLWQSRRRQLWWF
jgi:hypothetical protein